MNSSNVTLIGEDALGLFQRIVYTPVFVVGLVLNVSALWLFVRARKWTVTHIYMLNLIVADLLLILFLPFRIFETFHSIPPSALCTFLICVHYSNMYVSILTITAISVHRFLAIRFPLRTRNFEARRKTVARVVCALIWAVVMGLCTIFHEDLLPKNLRRCYERRAGQEIRMAFLVVLETVGFLLPVATVTVCSMQAICLVQKSAEDNLRNMDKERVEERKRVVAIITANMIVFIVCFTPVHIGFLLKRFNHDMHGTVSTSHVFFEVSEWIATTNCCLDSVGYYFLLKHVFKVKGQPNS